MCGHGWRHSFVTNCKENFEYKSEVIYKQMSHTIEKDAAKATYDKAEFLPARTAMMQDYADYLDSLRHKAKLGNQTAEIYALQEDQHTEAEPRVTQGEAQEIKAA